MNESTKSFFVPLSHLLPSRSPSFDRFYSPYHFLSPLCRSHFHSPFHSFIHSLILFSLSLSSLFLSLSPPLSLSHTHTHSLTLTHAYTLTRSQQNYFYLIRVCSPTMEWLVPTCPTHDPHRHSPPLSPLSLCPPPSGSTGRLLVGSYSSTTRMCPPR